MNLLRQRTLLVALALGIQSGFGADWQRATAPREWTFPGDHGNHPEFKTEWWYLTGNLRDGEGRPFGYQLTFFRHGLIAQPAEGSTWRARDIYFAHFAVADVGAGKFHAFENVNRAALSEAGAATNRMDVWNGEWALRQTADEPFRAKLWAERAGVAIDLEVETLKPLVLQGDRGLSRKSAEQGNASHYYSFTRLATRGTVRVSGVVYEVEGLSWLDREFSTSALGPEQVGWDWVSLQLDSGEEWMIYRLRNRDGSRGAVSCATRILADGSTQIFKLPDFDLEPTGSWRSPRNRATYPSGWLFTVPTLDCKIAIAPQLLDQELSLSRLGPLAYWEGSCRVTGSGTGFGYVELTGYAGDISRAMREGPPASP